MKLYIKRLFILHSPLIYHLVFENSAENKTGLGLWAIDQVYKDTSNFCQQSLMLRRKFGNYFSEDNSISNYVQTWD